MQKYADIAMPNGVVEEAAGRSSGGFCLARGAEDFRLRTSDFQGKPLPTSH